MLSLQVDRASPLPLHYQLQHQLRVAIEGGRLVAGDALPTEHALMAQTGVSRHTLRQAIDELVREGRLVRQRGRGTFVAEPPVAQSLGRFYSFARDQAAEGRHPTSRVLRLRRIAPAVEVAAALGLSRRERVIGSLYDLLERWSNIRVSHAEEVVRAVALDGDVADALAVPRGSPGFAVERTAYAGESAVELRSSRIRGDRYSFRVHLPAEQLTSEP
jgi:GntR family transcriptional regulator